MGGLEEVDMAVAKGEGAVGSVASAVVAQVVTAAEGRSEAVKVEVAVLEATAGSVVAVEVAVTEMAVVAVVIVEMEARLAGLVERLAVKGTVEVEAARVVQSAAQEAVVALAARVVDNQP